MPRRTWKTAGIAGPGKILAAWALLEGKERPAREDILAGFSGIRCRCTDPETLVEALTITADIRQKRLYGRST